MSALNTLVILVATSAMVPCKGWIYSRTPGKPLVPPPPFQLHKDPIIHLNLVEEFDHPPPPKYYPLSPEELEELFLGLSKQKLLGNFPKYPWHSLGGPLKSGDSQKCCGDEWTGSGSFGGDQYNLLTKPVFQLGHGYSSNQVREYRNFDEVKPVVEHIEGDLKYDFKTNTHLFP